MPVKVASGEAMGTISFMIYNLGITIIGVKFHIRDIHRESEVGVIYIILAGKKLFLAY